MSSTTVGKLLLLLICHGAYLSTFTLLAAANDVLALPGWLVGCLLGSSLGCLAAWLLGSSLGWLHVSQLLIGMRIN